jgi:hypothetical protein
MPRTDPRLLDMTPEDLWLEYLEDVAEKAPEKLDQLFKVEEDDTAVQYVTGNKEFDAVDEAAAKGDFEAVEKMLDSWGSVDIPLPDDGFSDTY